MVVGDGYLEQGWLAEYRRAIHDAPFAKDDPVVVSAWDELDRVPGSNISDIRKDFCGAIVRFENYGDIQSDYGWTVRCAAHFELRRCRAVRYWRACHVRNGKRGRLLVCAVTSDNYRNIEWDIRAPLFFFPRC